MKFDKTIAAQCRYGEVASTIWSDWNVLWEDSESDYHGHASFLAEKDGEFCFYEWDYGSCSGCDTWESLEWTDEQVAEEMRRTALWMKSEVELKRWLEMLEGNVPNSSYRLMEAGELTAESGQSYAEASTEPLMGRINAIRQYFKMKLLSGKDVEKIVQRKIVGRKG